MEAANELRIDETTKMAVRNGVEIRLTPTEYDLLKYLLDHEGVVLSREQILADVWGYEFAGETNLVDVYIMYLRRKIDKGFRDNLIQTVRGFGYMLKKCK